MLRTIRNRGNLHNNEWMNGWNKKKHYQQRLQRGRCRGHRFVVEQNLFRTKDTYCRKVVNKTMVFNRNNKCSPPIHRRIY